MESTVLLEKSDGVARIILNRPAQMNAINAHMLGELQALLHDIASDAEIRVVLVTGAGEKAFAAGADIVAMANMTPPEARAFAAFGQGVFTQLEALPQPTVAMVQGVALGGGCELALACDMRFAAEGARFGQPEVGLGITAGFGGTQRLPRLLGRGRASLLLLSGKIIKAPEAFALGLVDHVTAAEDLQSTVTDFAATLARLDPAAVQQTKRCIRHGLESGLDAGLAYEAQAFGLCFATDAPRQAMTAFANKKK